MRPKTNMVPKFKLELFERNYKSVIFQCLYVQVGPVLAGAQELSVALLNKDVHIITNVAQPNKTGGFCMRSLLTSWATLPSILDDEEEVPLRSKWGTNKKTPLESFSHLFLLLKSLFQFPHLEINEYRNHTIKDRIWTVFLLLTWIQEKSTTGIASPNYEPEKTKKKTPLLSVKAKNSKGSFCTLLFLA